MNDQKRTSEQWPNDPKLSDGGAWRGACPTVERTADAPNVSGAPLAESTRRDTRSRSLQRMVRRCGCFVRGSVVISRWEYWSLWFLFLWGLVKLGR